LFSNDDIAYTGPLNSTVSDALAGRMSAIHRLSVNALLVLIGLHVAAIAYYVRVRRDNVLQPMVTGWKQVARGEATQGGGALALGAAVLLAAVAVASISNPVTAPPAPKPVTVTVVSKPAW
jgi:hypothetical protein